MTRRSDFDDFIFGANCCKFYYLFITKKNRFLKIIIFEKSSKIYIFILKTQNWQQCQIQTWWPKTDFGFGFCDQILVTIRQNMNIWHFRPKFCRPVLSIARKQWLNVRWTLKVTTLSQMIFILSSTSIKFTTVLSLMNRHYAYRWVSSIFGFLICIRIILYVSEFLTTFVCLYLKLYATVYTGW